MLINVEQYSGEADSDKKNRFIDILFGQKACGFSDN